MKRIKEQTLIKMVRSLSFFKKFGILISFGVGLVAGVIKYIICKTFQCAFGYFMTFFIVAQLIQMIISTVFQVIAKQQIEQHYQDSIKSALDNQDLKNLNIEVDNNNIENKEKEDKGE